MCRDAVTQNGAQAIKAVRARLAAEGITEQDLEDAVAWARGTRRQSSEQGEEDDN